MIVFDQVFHQVFDQAFDQKLCQIFDQVILDQVFSKSIKNQARFYYTNSSQVKPSEIMVIFDRV